MMPRLRAGSTEEINQLGKADSWASLYIGVEHHSPELQTCCSFVLLHPCCAGTEALIVVVHSGTSVCSFEGCSSRPGVGCQRPQMAGSWLIKGLREACRQSVASYCMTDRKWHCRGAEGVTCSEDKDLGSEDAKPVLHKRGPGIHFEIHSLLPHTTSTSPDRSSWKLDPFQASDNGAPDGRPSDHVPWKRRSLKYSPSQRAGLGLPNTNAPNMIITLT